MTFTLQQVAQVFSLCGFPDTPITGWSVDTRSLKPGDAFFALRGPNLDGNDYIDQALERGAAVVVAERMVAGPVLQVPDSLRALQQLAAWARSRWEGDVIGVAGSAGKTSSKDLSAAHLS